MTEKKTTPEVVRNLQLVFSISVVLLILSLVASIYSIRKLISASAAVDHTNEVLLEVENVISSMKDAEASQRGYVITQLPAFMAQYVQALDQAKMHIRNTERLTVDNPVQQTNISELSKSLNQRIVQMDKVLNLVDNPDYDKAVLNANLIQGKVIMDEMRVIVDRIKDEEKRLMVIRSREQSTFVSFTPIFSIVAAIISILITIVSFVRIRGDINQRIHKQQEDERRFRETVERISQMENVTQEIASGNLAIRSNDLAEDELGRIGKALNHMAISLEANVNDLQTRNWLQEGSVLVSEAIRRDRDIGKLSANVLRSMAGYLDAPIGTLYVRDNEHHYLLSANFATERAPESIEYGKGLVGQAMEGKVPVVVKNLPPGFLRLETSLGITDPVSIVVVPLMYRDEPVGAMEFGFLREPTGIEMKLLETTAESIAIGVNSALDYINLQNFLEETQAQAEELQSQHSELENLNTELEAQAQRLQASEEELKVQQEELQQTNAELEERTRMLEEKNLEINRKAEELETTTRYKSEFLANMSHELRTPLNSILLLSRLLAENNERTLTPDQMEYAKVIQTSGRSLLGLIDEILDLSRIEAGKMELEYSDTKVEDLVEELKSMFSPQMKEKGIEFLVQIDKDAVPSIDTDRMKVDQIIRNLLSNALKFTSRGSISFNVFMDKKNAGFICFEVKDTGIGIPREKHHLIFEAFQQADGSTRRKFGGTGLGLSISRELARLLGGNITVESVVGEGSGFTVCIPVKRDQHPLEIKNQSSDKEKVFREKAKEIADRYVSATIPEPIADDRSLADADKKSILIVEDDVQFAKALLEYTRKQGYRAIVSVRGDEAVELARKYDPSGILLDLQLPVKSGWDVLDELKNDPRTRHIPVHIMSSFEMKKESLMKGAVDFINKPVAYEQMNEIFNTIENILEKKSKKVLIVEENPKHAKALSYFLETFRINSEIKDNVPDSVKALLSEDVDCVILDMGIPDAKTYDVLEEVKKNPVLEDLPVIVFTGKSLSMAEEKRIRQYADSIIVKTAHSYQRILDEVSLFLHLMEEQHLTQSVASYQKLGGLDQVLRHKTVLIVDDDVRNIFSISKALEGLQMNIIAAQDGKEALQRLTENPETDIVLLDMMMPRMDGYETASKIRANRAWRNLPVIAVTAKAMTGDREKCINAGASDYITKPVDLDQLLSLLRVWLYEK